MMKLSLSTVEGIYTFLPGTTNRGLLFSRNNESGMSETTFLTVVFSHSFNRIIPRLFKITEIALKVFLESYMIFQDLLELFGLCQLDSD